MLLRVEDLGGDVRGDVVGDVVAEDEGDGLALFEVDVGDDAFAEHFVLFDGGETEYGAGYGILVALVDGDVELEL